MASKVGVVLESGLEHGLLVLAQPVDPLHLPLVALPDVLQHLPLLLEALLWGLHGDERGCSDIAGTDYGMQGHDVWRDASWVRRAGWQLELGAQEVHVTEVL